MASERLKIDRQWSEYPLGTKAFAANGGHWLRVSSGWKWCTGSTFPTPGGDAVSVELPATTAEPPYFTDPLLQAWERGGWEERTRMKVLHLPGGAHPMDVFGYLAAWLQGCRDTVRLRSLILAELAGAKRAREAAKEWANITLHPDAQMYQRALMAREILEAFDGE